MQFFRGREKRRGSPLFRYLLPFVAVGGALATQIGLGWILPKGADFPYVVLYQAAMALAAWFGGYVPGAIACVLTLAGLPFLFNPSFRLTDVAPGQLILVLILCFLISLVAQTRRRRREVLVRADELDRRVQERTAELAQAVEALKSEIAEHKATAQTLQTQLERLNLLDQITRAIGERQDVRSIFQVVIRSLEDSLPIDFGCVCLYNADAAEVIVNCVGVRSEALAMELAMTDQAHISIDQNGLSQCVRGQLVYEADVQPNSLSLSPTAGPCGLGCIRGSAAVV